MRRFSFVMSEGAPVHARPAGKLVKLAKRYESSVQLIRGNSQSSCKCLVSVMCLNLQPGDRITLEVDGPDEDEAFTALKKFILEDFQNGCM